MVLAPLAGAIARPEQRGGRGICRAPPAGGLVSLFPPMDRRELIRGSAESGARGMRIGLIADLAVGMDGSGSHAWSRQSDILVGIEVGAPPDLFNARGQNWGLTAFSPRALVAGGFAPFIATLRAGMRNAGGLRIDHAMSF